MTLDANTYILQICTVVEVKEVPISQALQREGMETFLQLL